MQCYHSHMVTHLHIHTVKWRALQFSFIGEETCESKQEYTEAPTWMIDPIDGTTNFVHR